MKKTNEVKASLELFAAIAEVAEDIMPKIHEVKILPEYFDAVAAGVKTWELRYDDRGYAVGDLMILKEWKDGAFTGRRWTVKIIYILRDYAGLVDGWAILSIKKFRR